MKIYLAARYSRRLELCEYRAALQSIGLTVQARWLEGGHQIDAAGVPIGDNGEALIEVGSSRAADELREKFALDDYGDVSKAHIVINFTEPPRAVGNNRGGRHVEFGIALALGARCIVVGHRENIFHHLPVVEFYPTWEACFSKIKEAA